MKRTPLTALLLPVVSATAAAAVGLSAPARADQFDFVSQVESNGIGYSSISGMINVGTGACHDVREGYSPATEAAAIQRGGWSPYEAGLIMGAAANTMCPDIWPVLNAWAHQSAPAGGSAPCEDCGEDRARTANFSGA